MAAPTYVADIAIHGVNEGVADLTLTLPAHQADDVALAHVYTFDSQTATIPTPPTGWTQIATWDAATALANPQRHWLFGRRLTSGSETNPTFTRNETTGEYFGAGALYRGCDTSGTAWEVVGTAGAYTAEPCVVPGITTLTAESLVVATLGYGDNNAATVTATGTDPAAYTEHTQTTTLFFDAMVCFAEAARTTAGATGDITMDLSAAFTASRGAGAIAVALKPPSGSTDRRAQVTWAEMEVPNAPRRAIVSWAELEVPSAPRRAVVSWAELEVPDPHRRAVITWAELEVPDAPSNDRRAQITWAELEVPTAPRRALITWVEVEVPTAPRRAVVSWAEMEVPTAPRRAVVTWAELEVPDSPETDRRAIVTWAEVEVPSPRGGRGGFKRILYDPQGAQEAIDERPEWSPDDLGPLEARPLPDLGPLPEPRNTEPTPPVRLPKPPKLQKQIEAVIEIIDDEDEIDFIINVVLDLD
jgi:hypothetical protein